MNVHPLTVKVLQVARQLLEEEKSWVKGVFAAAEDRSKVDPHNDRASCFCALGALRAASYRVNTVGTEAYMDAVILLGRAASELSGGRYDNPVSFNDDYRTDHAMVLRMFDLAIAAASRRIAA